MSLEGADGVEHWTVRVQPGSILGLPALLGHSAYTMTAIAMPDAEVYFLSEDAFSKQMLTEPALALMVLRVLAAEVRSARGALSSAVTLQAPLSLN